jgi:hypothetical protein
VAVVRPAVRRRSEQVPGPLQNLKTREAAGFGELVQHRVIDLVGEPLNLGEVTPADVSFLLVCSPHRFTDG